VKRKEAVFMGDSVLYLPLTAFIECNPEFLIEILNLEF
jgi:hypothetical protein